MLHAHRRQRLDDLTNAKVHVVALSHRLLFIDNTISGYILCGKQGGTRDL